MAAASEFYVALTGQIESAQYDNADRIFCKVNFVSTTPDWTVIQGVEEGITQITRMSKDGNRVFSWNFPLEISWSSTNVSGWPQLVVTVFAVDFRDRHVLMGYGLMHVPTAAGRYTHYIRTFQPQSSSPFQSLYSAIIGDPPEFRDGPSFVTKGENREVVRVTSGGMVKVQLDIVTKNMEAFGYTDCASGAKEPQVSGF